MLMLLMLLVLPFQALALETSAGNGLQQLKEAGEFLHSGRAPPQMPDQAQTAPKHLFSQSSC